MAHLARGYTHALFAAAQTLEVAEASMHDLHAVQELVASCKSVFYNPSIPTAELITLLRTVLDGRIQPLIWEFVCLLLSKRILKWLPDIDKQYQQLVSKWQGQVTVRLRVPFAPEESLLPKLSQFLAAQGMFGEKQRGDVRFDVQVQPDLLGGFIAEYDNRVLDTSLKTQLQALRADATKYNV